MLRSRGEVTGGGELAITVTDGSEPQEGTS